MGMHRWIDLILKTSLKNVKYFFPVHAAKVHSSRTNGRITGRRFNVKLKYSLSARCIF
jgi:hypothetical protein